MSKQASTRAALIVTGYAIVAVLIYVVLSYDLLSLFWNDEIALVVLPPLKAGVLFIIVAIAFFQVADTVTAFFKGRSIRVLDFVLRGFGVAFLVYFAFTFVATVFFATYQALAFPIFLLIIIGFVYYSLSSFLRDLHQITLLTLLRFSSILLLGVTLRFALLSIYAEYITIIADVVTFGFIFAALSALFYPLKYSDKSALKKIGGWMGEGTMSKFVFGVAIALYLILVRPYFVGMNSSLTLVLEWLTIGMITVAGFLWLRSKLEVMSAPLLLETWTKHKQELNFKSTDELNMLSRYIEEFLDYGKKNDVLLYLFNFLFERKIPRSGINSALGELIDYQDKQAPRIFFAWEASAMRKENFQNRFLVLKRIIRNLNENILYFK